MTGMRKTALLWLGALVLTCVDAVASSGGTREVVVTERYLRPPGGQRWLSGEDYRDLWATPVELEVLDLEAVAGGLVPVMRVGGLQTSGLAMKGGDGRSYTFRSAEKTIRGALPQPFWDTGFELIVQDLMSSSIPSGELLVPPLASAIGVLHVDARLVVMPDDPRLGEFRSDFANVVGTFLEFPTDGFGGSTEVLGPEEFLARRRTGPNGLPDSRAFLRARLLDFLIGDWDRHFKQWRWARIPGLERLQPIPEDRDQAFSAYDGAAMDVVRAFGSQMVDYGDRSSSVERMIRNGADHDRLILADLERPEWMAIAREVAGAVTDEVIRDAVNRLPEAFRSEIGDRLARRLETRREGLEEAAARFYELISRRVDVNGTDRPELFDVERASGGARGRVAVLDEVAGRPYFDRRFDLRETREVRLYLHGGEDRVRVHGHDAGAITIRVIAGDDGDRVADEIGTAVERYDFPGQPEAAVGRDPASQPPLDSIFTSSSIRMPGAPELDWGKRSVPAIVVGYHRDPGFVLGGGYTWKLYRFRSEPWAQRHQVRAGLAFGPGLGMAEYRGGFRWPQQAWWLDLRLRGSSLDQLRYYGPGNESTADRPDSAYRIRERRLTLLPALARGLGRSGTLEVGPVLRFSDSRDTGESTVLAEQRPLGFGTFSEVGLRIGWSYDDRTAHRVLQSGLQLRADAALVPAVGDVEAPYGWVAADVGWHVSLSPPTLLSVYGGGKKLWGSYPFFEAAYLGGQGNALGYHWNRFAGDAAVHGSAQVRWTFKRVRWWVPGELGLTAGVETGRGFSSGEDSDRWHGSAGVGLYFAPFDRWSKIEIGVAVGSEDTFVILRSGIRLAGVR